MTKQRPKSGWPGSVTSTSVKSSTGGLLTGVLRCVLVRAYEPYMALGHVAPAHRRPGLAPPDSHMAEGRYFGHGWPGRPSRDWDAPRWLGLARPRKRVSALCPRHMV